MRDEESDVTIPILEMRKLTSSNVNRPRGPIWTRTKSLSPFAFSPGNLWVSSRSLNLALRIFSCSRNRPCQKIKPTDSWCSQIQPRLSASLVTSGSASACLWDRGVSVATTVNPAHFTSTGKLPVTFCPVLLEQQSWASPEWIANNRPAKDSFSA